MLDSACLPIFEDAKVDLSLLNLLVSRGGPDPSEYEELNRWFAHVYSQLEKGALTETDLHAHWDALGDAASPKTCQGYVMRKPRGYAGDFEIIDRIYTYSLAEDLDLVKWDQYFHAQQAPQAVRNRKTYFLDLLDGLQKRCPSARVLNLASGPCRDVYEFFSREGDRASLGFTCIDLDPNAITHAQRLLEPWLDRVTFTRANVLRYRPDPAAYDLVWCAGLFDYLDTKAFTLVFSKLLTAVRPGGELVIGNFSTDNVSRPYMEFAQWSLIHRSPQELIDLAVSCGVSSSQIEIRWEPTRVNLFAHIKVD